MPKTVVPVRFIADQGTGYLMDMGTEISANGRFVLPPDVPETEISTILTNIGAQPLSALGDLVPCNDAQTGELRKLVFLRANGGSMSVPVYSRADLLRSHLGNRPIYINSWYRPPSINKSVGGKQYSRHQFGDAVDLRSDYYSPQQIEKLFEVNHNGGFHAYAVYMLCGLYAFKRKVNTVGFLVGSFPQETRRNHWWQFATSLQEYHLTEHVILMTQLLTGYKPTGLVGYGFLELSFTLFIT
ncbi:MAG: hypothetical protein HC775_06900 [Hyellaceae cyanobacterium CSU_1_1]|nr:hypothetical protein [Pleurocapsa sp. CRU_1_2]NJR45533.1 hypothetical protein [Hyellaceae cyanobacterium CSU_1_1]